MNLTIIVLLVIIAGWILYQDYTSRQAHLIALLLFCFLTAVLQFKQHLFWQTFLVESIANLLITLLMLAGVSIYLRVVKKIDFKESIGLGDLIVFVAFITAYDISTFVIHFCFGLLASLFIHVLIKKHYKKFKTVPLAGYMAVYLSIQKYLAYLELL